MNDSNKFWKHLKKVIPGKCTVDTKITSIDQTTNTEIEESKTADFINNYFTNIGYNLSRDLTEPWSYTGIRAEVKLMNIEPKLKETVTFCKEINIHIASSVPGLSSKLLKEAFIHQAAKLKYIYDQIVKKVFFLQLGNVQQLSL